jgi:hypothetical protein
MTITSSKRPDDIRDHRPVSAQVHHSGDESISLQIELPNDMAVLLTVSREDGACVTLWHGSGEFDFDDLNVERFREWLALASFGRGIDLDVANREEERIIALLFEVPRSLEELTAATYWPPSYLDGVLGRLIHHWNVPAIELRDGRYQLTDIGRSFHVRNLPRGDAAAPA